VPAPDTVAVPTTAQPAPHEVGAVADGPNTLNVTVPLGEDPPDTTAATDDAAIGLPSAPDAGALSDSVGLLNAAGLRPVKPLPELSTTAHSSTDGHATPESATPETPVAVLFGVDELGSKVTSPPLPFTAVHRLAEGHASAKSPCPELTVWDCTAVGGEVGLNVASVPFESTAVHWDTVEQATASASSCTTWYAVGEGEEEVGSNVISAPWASSAVHWVSDGHATDVTVALSIVCAVPVAGDDCGLNVTSEAPNTAVHWDTDGHATEPDSAT
jgi:hypothetical protein